MTYAAEVAGLIIRGRHDKHISSQSALARLVGVSEATVGRWERAEALPDAWDLRQLETVLGVTPEQLLHPDPVSDLERELFRRVNRATSAAVRRARQDG